MLYAIRFKRDFNNFNVGDVIKFRQGSFFTAPFGGGKTTLLNLIFEYLATNNSVYIEGNGDNHNTPVFFLTFRSGSPELFFHNVDDANVKRCNELIIKNDFIAFYKLFENVFTNSILIVDDLFNSIMQYNVSYIRDLLVSGIDTKDRYTSPHASAKNNQIIISGTMGYGSYYNEHELYYIPSKVWVSSNFLGRCGYYSELSLSKYLKKERSTGYLVRIKGIQMPSYDYYNSGRRLKTISDKFVETSTSITSSVDAAKIYATKYGAEKVIELFKDKTKSGSACFNNRRCFKSGNTWYSGLHFDKATYDILTTEELNDMLFTSEEF